MHCLARLREKLLTLVRQQDGIIEDKKNGL